MAAHEELAMAQEEAALIARKLAELDAQSTTITKERKLLDGEHSRAERTRTRAPT